MPNAYDDFTLTVENAINANIYSSTQGLRVGSGENFTIGFKYIGGLNPAATAFEVKWYANDNDRNLRRNALTGAQAPSGVTFQPNRPSGGGQERSGSLTGRAPTLGGGETDRNIYGELAIIQAALNA